MSRYYDSVLMTDDEILSILLENYNLVNKAAGYQYPVAREYPIDLNRFNDDVAEDDNLVWDVIRPRDTIRYSDFARTNCYHTKIGFKVNRNANKRACIVRVNSHPFRYSSLSAVASAEQKNVTVDSWIILTNAVDAVTFNFNHLYYGDSGTDEAYPDAYGETLYYTPTMAFNYKENIAGNALRNLNNNNVETTINTSTSIGNYYSIDEALKWLLIDAADKSKLHNIHDSVIAVNSYIGYSGNSVNYDMYKAMPNTVAFADGYQMFRPLKFPESLPVFDIEDSAAIIKYLNTGDDSGKYDPFDTVPRVEPISDYRTDFELYISANDKVNNKYSIVSYNAEYNKNRYELQGYYELKASTSIPFDVNKALRPSQAEVPTITFNQGVHNRDEISFYFGEVGYTENYSGCFQVSLLQDPTSRVNVKINTVYWSDYPGEEGSVVSGVPITDGYKFTASSGETLRIYFRSISLDDIKDIIDDNYPSKDDDDNNRTGSDVIPLYGSGLRTYILSDGAFDQVNKALWNTDWSTVFKSTTIDPIKCVISCKRIPFTVSGTSADTIYLANRDIAASTSFISPVKKFRIGSYTIPAIYGNFVDITMTKIHVYLPYIGWKELPAPEVMSRVGRAQVGLQSKTYNLTFDYIVDFVDGNVRCIVSVNGTERWYFDGNCAIDVPVTSDNHTAAVSTAIKSGVATVMSVGSTIGGMWSGNALAVGAGMIGTIQNGMNVVPTYEYSATGSPSGYIDATMNKHIMLVIEYPNAFYPSGYSHKVGLPCMLNLSLGSCSGFTRTVNVDTRGINCTADESDMIKNLLNAGVYL